MATATPRDREATYQLLHQTLLIGKINFAERSYEGCTRMRIKSKTERLKRIRINCARQIGIKSIKINETMTSYKRIDDVINYVSYDLDSFCRQRARMVRKSANGELRIKIPAEVGVSRGGVIEVRIDFRVVNPATGIHFVVDSRDTDHQLSHLYTSKYANQARTWFPCVDSYASGCSWMLQFTVGDQFTAVSGGRLMEVIKHRSLKSFRYELDSSTAAPNICLAVGRFEIHPDPMWEMEVTHFCLPHLKEVLASTTAFLGDVMEFFNAVHELPPLASYNQVFVKDLVEDAVAYSGVGLFSTNLLHSGAILDQNPITRQKLVRVFTEQYFGCSITYETHSDMWVTCGVSAYLYGIWFKHTFGKNEYKHWIRSETDTLCEYELNKAPVVLTSGEVIITEEHREMVKLKAHMALRRIEASIGQSTLTAAVCNVVKAGRPVVSTASFLRFIYTISDLDITSEINGFINSGGVPHLRTSFDYDMKSKDMILHVDQGDGVAFNGPLAVRTQEPSGVFQNTIQVQENVRDYHIHCHPYKRNIKRGKILLLNGEEAAFDVGRLQLSVMWVRVNSTRDHVYAKITHTQPDHMWQHQAVYSRDACSQLDAVMALVQYPSVATVEALHEVFEEKRCYYRVRVQVCESLQQVYSQLQRGPLPLIQLFQSHFSCLSAPGLVRSNDFTDFDSYFTQRALVAAIARFRDHDDDVTTPPEVRDLVMHLAMMNDNKKNRFSDNYYRCTLIDAMSSMLNPNTTINEDTEREVLSAVVHYVNVDHVIPSYRRLVTCSGLRAIWTLQKLRHLKRDLRIFHRRAKTGSEDIRLAAVQCLVDALTTAAGDDVITIIRELMEMVRNHEDHPPRVRLEIVRQLIGKFSPPSSTTGSDELLNRPEVVRLVWSVMRDVDEDSRVEALLLELIRRMRGGDRPRCMGHVLMDDDVIRVSGSHDNGDGVGAKRRMSESLSEESAMDCYQL